MPAEVDQKASMAKLFGRLRPNGVCQTAARGIAQREGVSLEPPWAQCYDAWCRCTLCVENKQKAGGGPQDASQPSGIGAQRKRKKQTPEAQHIQEGQATISATAVSQDVLDADCTFDWGKPVFGLLGSSSPEITGLVRADVEFLTGIASSSNQVLGLQVDEQEYPVQFHRQATTLSISSDEIEPEKKTKWEKSSSCKRRIRRLKLKAAKATQPSPGQ